MNNITLLVLIAAALLLFVPFALLVPGQSGFELLDALAIALAFGGLTSYYKEAWQALKMPVHKLVSAHYIVVGVFFTAISMGALFGGLLYWRVTGQSLWIINSIGILFTRWISVLALGFFMLTSYSRSGIIQLSATPWPTIVSILTFTGVLMAWWTIAH